MSSRFSFDAAARAATKQQILDGHNMLGGGATACMCASVQRLMMLLTVLVQDQELDHIHICTYAWISYIYVDCHCINKYISYII